MDDSGRVVVTLALAEALPAALGDALAQHFVREAPRFPSPIAVADASARRDAPGENDFGLLVVREFAALADGIGLVVPAGPLGLVLGRVAHRGRVFSPVDVSGRAERLTTVWLPTSIVNAGSVIAVNDVRRETVRRPVLAIGGWSRFVRWRERLGARLAKPELGFAAEIALAVRPALILLAVSWRERTAVIATSDQIAAELVGLAVTRAGSAATDDLTGPWQDELVQRATELDLGVRLPDRMAIRLVQRGRCDAVHLLEDVAGRLGVTDVALTPF